MKVYKIVVAGCGGMSNVWLDYAEQRDDVEIVGLVDIREESAKAMADRRGLKAPTFDNLELALQQTQANLVFDITIPASHKQVVSTALSAGCHVFGEKPMAESMEDASELLRLSGQTGKRYAVMQNRRYLRQIRALRDFVSGGAIGDIGSLHADFFIGAHFGGFRDLMDSPLILDMAIHTFDQARLISGADPVSVYCHEFNPPGSWYRGNASAICIFEMSNGAVFSYRGSWCSEGFRTSWEADWRIIGSNGTIRWDGANSPTCEIADASKPLEFLMPIKLLDVPVEWEGREGHWGCLDEMFASLEQNRLAETDASDNIKSMAMVFGALESNRTGRKVKL
jgi:predicted dehydrogenase